MHLSLIACLAIRFCQMLDRYEETGCIVLVPTPYLGHQRAAIDFALSEYRKFRTASPRGNTRSMRDLSGIQVPRQVSEAAICELATLTDL